MPNFGNSLDIGENDLVTGCVGRIKWGRKGQEHLIQAAHLLKTRGIISKILIVGSPFPGNEIHLERLKELARELDVEDQIIFTGEVADAKPAYASMDIFVLPSAYPEPFGGVVMEAMSMGLPVIATNLGGSLDQVVEGVTGFLVPPADPKRWPRESSFWPTTRSCVEKWAPPGGSESPRNFSLSEMVKKIEAVYDSRRATESPSRKDLRSHGQRPRLQHKMCGIAGYVELGNATGCGHFAGDGTNARSSRAGRREYLAQPDLRIRPSPLADHRSFAIGRAADVE